MITANFVDQDGGEHVIRVRRGQIWRYNENAWLVIVAGAVDGGDLDLRANPDAIMRICLLDHFGRYLRYRQRGRYESNWKKLWELSWSDSAEEVEVDDDYSSRARLRERIAYFLEKYGRLDEWEFLNATVSDTPPRDEVMPSRWRSREKWSVEDRWRNDLPAHGSIWANRETGEPVFVTSAGTEISGQGGAHFMHWTVTFSVRYINLQGKGKSYVRRLPIERYGERPHFMQAFRYLDSLVIDEDYWRGNRFWWRKLSRPQIVKLLEQYEGDVVC